jgi:hypothetical protein
MTRVADLAGAQLALWVAQAAGICLHDGPTRKECGNWGTDYFCVACGKETSDGPDKMSWRPHENWSQGGPIIDNQKISFVVTDWGDADLDWAGYEPCLQSMTGMAYDGVTATGPTPLIAAMRAFVASKFGDKVNDPS